MDPFTWLAALSMAEYLLDGKLGQTPGLSIEIESNLGGIRTSYTLKNPALLNVDSLPIEVWGMVACTRAGRITATVDGEFLFTIRSRNMLP